MRFAASAMCRVVSVIALGGILLGCKDDKVEEMIDCTQSDLNIAISNSTDASSCIASDGAIAVFASGGLTPYSFSIGSISNTDGLFQNLAPGIYSVNVSDGNNCERSLDVVLNAVGSTLSLSVTVSPDTDCLTDNGMISAVASGGVAPFEFSLNGSGFGTASNFNNLEPGNYLVEVRDSEGCIHGQSATVVKGNTSVSYVSQIGPIIATKCAISSCHNGDNGASRDWSVFSNVKSNASNIKTRTGNRSMPPTGSLTQEQIDLIACWVDDGALNN